jgi:hypothetical protein
MRAYMKNGNFLKIRNMGVGATGTLGQGWTIHGQQYSTLQKLAVDLRFQSLHQN